jgi:hypothetical protein
LGAVLAAHAGAILACDFFTVDTMLRRTLYVLVFLEIGSLRLLYANCTAHPNAAWVTQQTRNLTWELNQLEAPIRVAIHDRDSKFVDEFDQVLRSDGARVALTPYRCPRANAHCERMIKTLCHEALDWLLIFGERLAGSKKKPRRWRQMSILGLELGLATMPGHQHLREQAR